jgi:ADP-heptose:LPS heptosyltransferase
MSKPEIRLIVVQLSGLDKVLQSLMALKAAHQQIPKLKISMIVNETCAEAARSTQWVDEVFSFEKETVIEALESGTKSESQAFAEVARWLTPIIQEPYDVLVNWTYSDASGFLAGLIPASVKLGYLRDQEMRFSCADAWSYYVQAIIKEQVPQNIHLIDVFTTQLLTMFQIQFQEEMADETEQRIPSKQFFTIPAKDRMLIDRKIDPKFRWIGVQLGEYESWDGVCDFVLRRHRDFKFVFFGSQDQVHASEKIIDRLEARGCSKKQFVSLVGETSFRQWALAVSECSWVFCEESSVVPLSSLLGTRTLMVSSEQKKWEGSAPYGNGHILITRPDPVTIDPEVIYGAWSHAVSEWSHQNKKTLREHYDQIGCTQKLEDIEVYRSHIRSLDEGGGVAYKSVLNDTLGMGEWTATVLGEVARSWFCGWNLEIGHDLRREALQPGLLSQLRELEESSRVLESVCLEARDASRKIHSKASSLKSENIMGVEDKKDIQELGNKLLELDQLIERLSNVHSPLTAFSKMQKVMMHNLKGDSIADMGQESAQAYTHILSGVRLFREWIEMTLKASRPGVIKQVEKTNKLGEELWS